MKKTCKRPAIDYTAKWNADGDNGKKAHLKCCHLVFDKNWYVETAENGDEKAIWN